MNQDLVKSTTVIQVATIKNTNDSLIMFAKVAIMPNQHFLLSAKMNGTQKEDTG